MKVILISEDNHGQIGVANNYYNAVKWLIDNHWITAGDGVYINHEWKTVVEVFGDNWADLMLNEWNIYIFNDYWEDCFYLDIVPVIGTEED